MLTTVCQPAVLLSFTHTETVKLCAVFTTGLKIGTMPAEVPLRAIAGAPPGPVLQLAPLPRSAVLPLPEESAVVVPLPSSIAQWPASAGRVAAAWDALAIAKAPPLRAPRQSARAAILLPRPVNMPCPLRKAPP